MSSKIKHFLYHFVLVAAFVLSFFTFIAPVQIGGPNSFAIVRGDSMEPMFQNNDFVLATAQSQYKNGDIIIYKKMGGLVIHQIVPCGRADLFCTKGINNQYPDSWGVRSSEILGKFKFKSSFIGEWIVKISEHPIQSSLFLTLIFSASFIPLPHHRRTKLLRRLIADSTPVSKMSRHQLAKVLYLSILLLAASMASFFVAVAKGNFTAFESYASLTAFIISLSLTLWSSTYIFNGHGLLEPYKSIFILNGKLFQIHQEERELDQAVKVKSALALRNLADRHRLPVIYMVTHPEQVHKFFLITHKEIYFWEYDAKDLVFSEPKNFGMPTLPRPEAL